MSTVAWDCAGSRVWIDPPYREVYHMHLLDCVATRTIPLRTQRRAAGSFFTLRIFLTLVVWDNSMVHVLSSPYTATLDRRNRH